MPDADYEHQERQDQLSDLDIAIHHAVLEGGKRATFYASDGGDPIEPEGWVVDCNGMMFVWALAYGSYGFYNLRVLENTGGPQYICCGVGPVPIGYAVVE